MSKAFPIQPLIKYLTDRMGPARNSNVVDNPGGGATVHAMARECGVSQSAFKSYQARGGMMIDTADRLATNLGIHPSQIWPAEYWSIDADEDVA